jgi:aldehyde:ferredoxin oxidoreductase
MLDYTWQGADGSKMAQALETGIYSEHRAKLVAWHRHYTRAIKQSLGYCDWLFPRYINAWTENPTQGYSPEAEPRFFNAVTGNNMTMADLMEVGRRIWNRDRAIWVLQGRHRDMENLTGYMFKPPETPHSEPVKAVYEDGKWVYKDVGDMYLDKDGFEQWKTHFCEVEGWDTTTGWPTRSTLEGLGLKNVADTLDAAGKLGT